MSINKVDQWIVITLLLFCLLYLDEWIVPDISGQCMPPNHAFIMESIHNTRAIIFGGSIEGGSTFSNTIYIVDIIGNTLVCYIIIYTLTNNML